MGMFASQTASLYAGLIVVGLWFYISYKITKKYNLLDWNKVFHPFKNKSKGVWADFMTGIFVIGAITICYIILQQVYEADIKPYSVREGSDPTNMGYIELAWDFWPVPVMIGFLFMLIKAGYSGRKSTVDIYE